MASKAKWITRGTFNCVTGNTRGSPSTSPRACWSRLPSMRRRTTATRLCAMTFARTTPSAVLLSRLRLPLSSRQLSLETAPAGQRPAGKTRMENMLNVKRLRDATAEFAVTLDAGQLEIATADGRKAFKSLLAVVDGTFECPAIVGDVDPLMSAVMRLLPPSPGNLLHRGEAAAGATRRVAQLVQDALAATSPKDLSLLRGIKIIKEDAVHPKSGLDLSRSVIRAAYYFWHKQGNNMTLSSAPRDPPSLSFALQLWRRRICLG